jgi:transposase
MIQTTAHMRIFVARQPADFRAGFDGTAALCRQALAQDPLSGAVFVFRNRRGTMIRILAYDGQGLWLMTKRLSQGRFPKWDDEFGEQQAYQLVQAHQLQVLLAGGDFCAARAPAPWRRIDCQTLPHGAAAGPSAHGNEQKLSAQKYS